MPLGELVGDMGEQTERKVSAIAQAQRDGHVDPALAPEDVLAMVLTMALAWGPTSLFFTAAEDDPETEHDRRRAGLAAMVRRAVGPEPA